ncbi:MAG TPA: glycine cleavage system aminomethyltransferase GcvT [Bacteroidales bacterium]|nr:glycine cleavage system aminomethyltransferase GcvT [Bacteroidales bacterium]
MKDTALTKIHESLGAKMVPFAGYNMPIQYEGVNAEHETVRTSVGVFDVSHMGEIWVKGPKAVELLQRITTNDITKLEDGHAQYSCFPNSQGGIVDDLIVYRFDAENYLLVVNASNIEKDWKWMNEHNTNGATLYDASDETSLFAIQGPKAMATLQKLTDTDLSTIGFYNFRRAAVAGVPDVIISATGYTGEKNSFEIYFGNDDAEKLWKALFEAGEEFGIKPIGLGARDTLRLEMGFCLYGNDIGETTSPIEAGMGWITKFVDNKPFIFREYHEKIKKEGPKRRLRGFEMIDKGIPRQHYEICDEKGNVIGEVTSGTMAPSLKKPVGLGYIDSEHAGFDNEIFISIRGKLLRAKIVKVPFYKG